MDYDVPVTTKQVRNRVREEIEKNRQINDIRTIDMLVVKVRIESFLYSHSREALIISCLIHSAFNLGPNGFGRDRRNLETAQSHYGLF